MDAGNCEEQDRLGATLFVRDLASPSPLSSPRRPLRYHNHDPLHHNYLLSHDHEQALLFLQDEHADHYKSAAAAESTHDTALTSTPVSFDGSPFASHVATNRDAAQANAIVGNEARGFSNPDDLYRSAIDGSMASTLSASRYHQGASLHQNGSIPSPNNPAARSGTRSAIRSASTPIEEKPAAGMARSISVASSSWNSRAVHKPSVKDLKKKFDQNAMQMNGDPARKTQQRIQGRETPWSGASGHASHDDVRCSAASSLSASSTSTLRSTHRQRAVPENNATRNAQSFASRIAKPRTSIGSDSKALKSLTSLIPAISSVPALPLPQSRALLFGEIDTAELDTGLAGHGIDSTSGLRTSDSNVGGRLGRRQRSFSFTDVGPSSPTGWPRDERREHGHKRDADAKRSQSSHSRSRSDLGFVKPTQQQTTATQTSRPKPSTRTSGLVSPSRIPVSVRKKSSPSSPSSPNSTRSNSPSTVRKSLTQARMLTSNHNTAGAYPSPVIAPTSKRRHRPGALTPNNNTRLNAYISVPLPKLSPPLRSSRPRQPVSTATTVSSRTKTSERDKSPGKGDARANVKGNEAAARRWKISLGPIDYESRREQIKLSYTRSLRENEARAASRRAAQERKKKEAEAEAERKALASQAPDLREEEENEKKAEEQGDQAGNLEENTVEARAPELNDAEVSTAQPLTLRMITSSLTIESPVESQPPAEELLPLQPSDTDPMNEVLIVASDPTQEVKGSPALDIPGSFPNIGNADDMDEAPPSAISNTTEFDAEPQTEPPSQESAVVGSSIKVPIPIGIDENVLSAYQKAEYRSPFEAMEKPITDDGLSIEISLDPSTESAIISEEPSALGDDLDTAQSLPVTCQGGTYEPAPLGSTSYETRVTILPPGSEFTSPTFEIDGPVASAPTAGQQSLGDSNLHGHIPASAQRYSDESVAQSDNEQREPSSGLSEIAKFFVGPLIKDQHTRRGLGDNREMLGFGTEVDSNDLKWNDTARDPADALFSPGSNTSETRASLTMPQTSVSLKRTSQTTMWTDYSVDSQESRSDHGPAEVDPRVTGPSWHGDFVIDMDTKSRSQTYRYTRDSLTVPDSRDVSPRGARKPEAFESQIPRLPQHQLPEIDTGEAFDEAILSRKNSTGSCGVPAIPTHSPPLPPDDISFRDGMSSAPTSDYYDETRPNSYLRSEMDDNSLVLTSSLRRDSDFFQPSESAGRSSDQGSLATSEGHPSGSSRLASQQTLVGSISADHPSGSSRLTSQQTLVESINVDQTSDLSPKEKKRLFTRLEIIKELIDTEAFFIRDMNIVEEIYKGTAEACPKLDDQTIKLIFRNTDKILAFHTEFLVALKGGVSSIYTPIIHRSAQKDASGASDGATSSSSGTTAASSHLSDVRDRETSLGPVFVQHVERMKQVHETFLKNSDHAAKRLIQIQEDPTVQVWLNECNEVARELTHAWNLDSLLIKPMQRITKYPNLLIQLLHETPQDHPDRASLETARAALENAIEEINKTKKNFELVGQIVSRRRKESDVKAGFARAFGKRVDRLQAVTVRPAEDAEYLKLHERFGDDYLRLQVVLRDVEFYTRQVTEHVREFLQYLSSMELVMRLQASPYPEIESKWVRFNVSMRDMEKVALEEHVGDSRQDVLYASRR
ncbi:hypothetical protein F5Y17DRAFT_425044 [Xylariaceae sp. FL0594]|nr:hypothetical protein F5Y17DRAFT_425044 [Xylariaceae sp. FL0594]